MSATPQPPKNFHQSNSQCRPSSSGQTMEPEIVPCVEVRELSFYYKSSNPILTNINLTVPKGKIYALLGASGCGKTTLLRLILGTYKPLSGTINVFGHRPGTPESNIPGVGVGYMPQDLALFKLLSIEENLTYYGSLYGMSPSTIRESVKLFIKLLDLPKKTRIVSQLSGGQQRRVSLAVAMIHKPPLLILDEPTVGVDSLLRQKIWDYLKESCTELGTTVIMTTHYTEEAIFSYRVGFIYSGTMLAEGDPQKLMLRYGCTSLEEVFFELCMRQKSLQFASTQSAQAPSVPCPLSKQDIPTIVLQEYEESSDGKVVIHNVILADLNKDEPHESSIAPVTVPFSDCLKASNNEQPENHDQMKRLKKQNKNRICGYRFRALFIKNYLLFKRSPHAIMLSSIMPAFQCILLCLTIAKNLEHIPLAVVNEEQNNRSSNSLSNLFIEQIDQVTLDLKYYNDLDQAINAIHSNQVRTVMRFPSNFSKYFQKRFLKRERIKDNDIKQSNIELYADTSHLVFHLYTYQTLLNAFEKFIRVFGQMIGYNPSYFNPLQIEEPIYGTMSVRYYEFFLPGGGILAVHAIAMLMGSFSFITERVGGHLERGFVAGTTTEELMLSNVLFFVFPIISLDLVMIFISFHVFDISSIGPLRHIFLMNFITGIQGVCIGIVISIVCSSEVTAMVSVFCIEMISAFSSGCFWPYESLPKSVQNIMIWNPATMPILSLRNIMYRGWPLLHFEVFRGILYSISFTGAVLLFGLIYFRMFK